mmetsp:Transcript_31050/g.77936  ORF Transcript_31050/g.77936 Transcript_31050/m.77936 type:complete len:295 (+) Transcript_31050:1568-2452(+)
MGFVTASTCAWAKCPSLSVRLARTRKWRELMSRCSTGGLRKCRYDSANAASDAICHFISQVSGSASSPCSTSNRVPFSMNSKHVKSGSCRLAPNSRTMKPDRNDDSRRRRSWNFSTSSLLGVWFRFFLTHTLSPQRRALYTSFVDPLVISCSPDSMSHRTFSAGFSNSVSFCKISCVRFSTKRALFSFEVVAFDDSSFIFSLIASSSVLKFSVIKSLTSSTMFFSMRSMLSSINRWNLPSYGRSESTAVVHFFCVADDTPPHSWRNLENVVMYSLKMLASSEDDWGWGELGSSM